MFSKQNAFAAIGIAASLALSCANGASAQTAEKGFEVCNRTKQTVTYATALNTTSLEERKKENIAYTFQSAGWYKLRPGECRVNFPGQLKYRYYLIYATASKGKWDGKIPICVQDNAFDMTTTGFCPAGKNQRRFFQVDTGNSKSFTYNLR